MRKIPLFLLLIALSIATYLFATSGGEGDSPLTSGPDSQAEVTPEALPDELPALESAGLDREPSNQEALGGLSDVAVLRIAKGEVVMPPACANEDELVIYAWSDEVSYENDGFEFVQFMSSREIGDSLYSGTTLLGSSPVNANGRFQLELTTTLEEVHLFALGKFAYSEKSVTAHLNEDKNETFLTTLCGAYIEGELLGLGAESPKEVDIELGPSRSSLGASGYSEHFNDQRTPLAANGHFKFSAIPAGHALEIRIEPTEMAPHMIEIESLSEGESHFVKHTLQAGGRISGRVVDPDGAPVAGARVRSAGGKAAIALGAWATRREETDENGEFSVGGLPSGGVGLVAKKDGYLDSGITPHQLGIGEEISGIVLSLSRGNSVEGTVSWPDGSPVVGANVELEFDRAALLGADSINSARGADGSATTDAEGLFKIGALGMGPFTVKAVRAPEGARLESWLADETELSALQDDEEGGYDETFGWSDSVNGIRPNSPSIKFVLSAPQVLAGRVVNAQGVAVEEYELVSVRLQDSALGTIGVETKRQQVADPEGRFLATGITVGTWNLYAVAEGYSRPEPTNIVFPRAVGADPIEISLELASSVSGVVLTSTGAPAKDASIRVKSTVSQLVSLVSEDLTEPTTKTKAGGHFRLEGLHSGEIELIAEAEGYASSEAVPIELIPGEETSGLRISLRIGGTITGELYGEDGLLAANATVQVLLPTDYTTQITSTDEDGFFRVEHLKPGSWQVIGLPNLMSALSGGDENQGGRAAVMQGMKIGFVELVDGAEEHVILGEPPADPIILSGVVSHRDEPLKGASITLFLEGKAAMPKFVSTDAQGRYEVTLDGAGDYILTVQRRQGGSYAEMHQSTFLFSVPKTSEHRQDLKLPGSEVRGRVKLQSGGPAANVPVSISPNFTGGYSGLNEQTNTVVATDSDGYFTIDGVREGDYHLRAGGLGYMTRLLSKSLESTEIFGQSTLMVTLGEDQLLEGLEFTLPQAGSIEAEVVDSTGAPVAAAAIFIRDEQGVPIESFSAASTDVEGRYKYDGLSEGTYQVSARTADLASAEGATVQVLPGETSSIKLQLESGTTLKVLTIDGDGKPISAGLRVVDSEGREHASYSSVLISQARMGTEGLSSSQQSIGPLPPGRYRIYALSSDGKSEDKPVNLRG
ncbi:MAG: carboxypeptidase-like regulatory domain-containing protein, partial [Planctomycetota bacterium]|nr:carboxypeptidase-like regulatory domain-containing protein [Planctomycetota bacterium]